MSVGISALEKGRSTGSGDDFRPSQKKKKRKRSAATVDGRWLVHDCAFPRAWLLISYLLVDSGVVDWRVCEGYSDRRGRKK